MSAKTSTLYFYKLPINLLGKNFVIEGIETYLANFTPVTKVGFQYQRFDVEKTIKVNMNQEYQLNVSSLTKYNFLKVTTTDSNETPNTATYYYFIKGAKQVAESTIEFSLEMDVLNTFNFSGTANPKNYTLSPKSLITREHKDRMKEFTLPNRYTMTIGGTIQDMTILYTGLVIIDPQQVDEDDPEFAVTPQQVSEIFIFEKSSGLKVMTLSSIYGLLCGRSDNTTLFIHEFDTSNYWYFNEDQYYIVPNIKSPDYAQTIIDNYTKYRYFTITPIVVYRRIVDKYQEGLSTTLFKKREETLYDENGENQFHIVFTSANAVVSSPSDTQPIYDNPVKLLIYSDVPYVVSGNTKRVVTFTSEQLPDYDNKGEFFIINKSDFVDGTSYVEYNGVKKYLSDFPSGSDGLVISRSYSVFGGWGWRIYNDWGTRNISWISTDDSTEFKVFNIKNINVWSGLTLVTAQKEKVIPTNSADSSGSLTSDSWTAVDLTNPKYIKAFEFPYCPIEFMTKSKIYTYPTNWSVNSGLKCLQCDKIQEETLSRLLVFDQDSPFNELSVGRKATTPLGEEIPRNIKFESKLFHSDYYQPKFVYDSVGLAFLFENCNVETILSEGDDVKFKSNYVVSKNVVSKFSFQFLQYVCDIELQDYNNVVCIERNNEQALYTNAYISYIKSGGYSYDQKKANSQNAMNGITTALSVMGGTASLVAGWGTGNAMLVTGGIAILSSTAGMVARNIHTAQEQDRSISQKITQNLMQSSNVQGCEDIDILKSFSGNKAKICYYELSDIMKNAMWDLFHYCGYATHEQKVPVVNTRLYFNFVQGEVILEDYTFNEAVAKSIIEKWKQGVTFFHKVSGDWDLDQQYENFETNLL